MMKIRDSYIICVCIGLLLLFTFDKIQKNLKILLMFSLIVFIILIAYYEILIACPYMYLHNMYLDNPDIRNIILTLLLGLLLTNFKKFCINIVFISLFGHFLYNCIFTGIIKLMIYPLLILIYIVAVLILLDAIVCKKVKISVKQKELDYYDYDNLEKFLIEIFEFRKFHLSYIKKLIRKLIIKIFINIVYFNITNIIKKKKLLKKFKSFYVYYHFKYLSKNDYL